MSSLVSELVPSVCLTAADVQQAVFSAGHLAASHHKQQQATCIGSRAIA